MQLLPDDRDKLNEAITLLEFLQDTMIAWDLNAVDLSNKSMYGFTFILGQISDRVKEAILKE